MPRCAAPIDGNPGPVIHLGLCRRAVNHNNCTRGSRFWHEEISECSWHWLSSSADLLGVIRAYFPSTCATPTLPCVQGQPILRLRADAVHTANLKRDAKCSLFVQPGEHPARLLARVTLIGAVEPVSEGGADQGPLGGLGGGGARRGGGIRRHPSPSCRRQAAASWDGCPKPSSGLVQGLCTLQPANSPPTNRPRAAELADKAAAAHNTLHAGGMGVDAPQPTDLYYRLAGGRHCGPQPDRLQLMFWVAQSVVEADAWGVR